MRHKRQALLLAQVNGNSLLHNSISCREAARGFLAGSYSNSPMASTFPLMSAVTHRKTQLVGPSTCTYASNERVCGLCLIPLTRERQRFGGEV
jgi:hypothetical protein